MQGVAMEGLLTSSVSGTTARDGTVSGYGSVEGSWSTASGRTAET